TQQLNHARAQEIDLRQWRNEVRRRLHLLKGTPSTSPYCTWVNDPPENPTITANWQPPPQTPTTDPDEPPF
ncbi:MAG: HNH endonuclease, partial [Mycolicibacterium sp.]